MTITTQPTVQDLIASLWQKRSWTHLKSFLSTLTTEDAYNRLITQAQQEGMPQYAVILKRHAHKKFHSFQTTLWQAEVLFIRGEHFKAEQLLKTKAMLAAFDDISDEQRAEMARLLARVYSALQRFHEAEEQLKQLEQLGKRTLVDMVRFLMAKGERQQAIDLIQSLAPDQIAENQHHLLLFLSDLYLLEGQPEVARTLLKETLSHHPEEFLVRMDLASVLYVTGDLEESLVELHAVNAWNPFHYAKWPFIMLEAHLLYKLSRFEELTHLVEGHRSFFQNHVYGNFQANGEGKRVLLELTQQVQHVNYCVPAALQLILQAFDVTEQQETIARAVREDEGTQLHHAREYMNQLGYESLYFKGDLATYKSLLDQGIPILVSTLIEMNAHVQVVVGYDDRLQALYIQDPNEVHPYALAYDKWQETYQLREGLSVVFLPEAKKDLVIQFDRNAHAFFDALYTLTAEESTESEDILTFSDQHPDNLSVAVMGLLSLTSQASSEQTERWLRVLEENITATHEDVRLLRAHHAFWIGHYKEALNALEGPELHLNSNALFIKGLSHLKMDALDEAEKALYQSLEVNPHQAVAYSYLARIELQREWRLRAYKWVDIAKELSPNDSFVRATEALVYFENGVYETAYQLFESLVAEDSKDSYALYEMARAKQFLGEMDQARTLYKASLEIDHVEPFAYLRLAEIEDDFVQKKAHLKQGIANLPEQGILYSELGLLEEQEGLFEAAQTLFEKAVKLQPADTDAVFYLARNYFKQHRLDDAWKMLNPHLESEDPVRMLLAVSFVMSEMNTTETKDRLITLLESRLREATNDDVDLYAMTYVDFASETRYRKQVIELFAELRARHATPELRSLEGQLHLEIGTQQFAKELFLEAGKHEVAQNQLAMMALADGDVQSAIAYYEKTLELQPYQTEALQGLMNLSVELESLEVCLAVTSYVHEVTTDIIEFDQVLEWIDDAEELERVLPLIDSLDGYVSAKWWYLLKARCAHIVGDFSLAETCYQKALAEHDAGVVLYRYVEFLLEMGRANEALPLIHKELLAQPEDPDWIGHFITALEQKKRIPLLLHHLKKLPKEHRKTYLVHAAQQLALRLAALNEDEPAGMIGSIKQKAQQFFYAIRIIQLYEEAIKLDPKDVTTIMGFAEFYLDADMPDEAIKLLRPLVNVEESEAKRMLVFAYAQQLAERVHPNDVQIASRYAQELIAEDPEDLSVLDWWAQVHGHSEDYKTSFQIVSQALAIDPYHADFLNMGWKSLELNYGEKALPHLDRFVESWRPVMKQHTELLLIRAVTLNDLGEGQRAKELLSLIPSYTLEYMPSLFETARAEVLLGHPRKAKRLMQEILRGDDGTYEAMAEEDPLLVELLG
ncbi:tetratricopeptide repeat protein [Chryseomicrobium palamuruense]|uniref:Tetratricopeptide repeat protein n=1 Tax=Chryseomicrobium palamuruense TaxID=682973 RepID=A0ABV8UT77_9BACL